VGGNTKSAPADAILVLPLGLALLRKGRHALLLVFQREHGVEDAALEAQTLRAREQGKGPEGGEEERGRRRKREKKKEEEVKREERQIDDTE